MKFFIPFFVALSMSCLAVGQSTVQFSYDNVGNRIQRKVSFSLIAESAENTLESLSSINQEDELKITKVYPNPTDDYLIVEVKQLTPDLQVKLIDGAGRVLIHQALKDLNTELRLLDLQAGTYIVLIRGEGLHAEWKVVKN